MCVLFRIEKLTLTHPLRKVLASKIKVIFRSRAYGILLSTAGETQLHRPLDQSKKL